MAHKARPPDKEPPESEEDPKGSRLKEIEQHISQRMNKLSEPAGKRVSDSAHKDKQAQPAASPLPNFIAPFEPFENYGFNAPTGYRTPNEDLTRPYQETAEVLKTVQHLSDLLTESVLKLNCRLNSLEEQLRSLSEVRPEELKGSLGEMKAMIQESIRESMRQRQSGAGSTGSGDKEIGSYAALITELQRQVQLLEAHVDRASSDVRVKVDERHNLLREQLDGRVKIVEKLARDSRDYLNRHFFNLAILLIIILFIAAAFIVHAVDDSASYTSQQLDALRVHLESPGAPANSGPPASSPPTAGQPAGN